MRIEKFTQRAQEAIAAAQESLTQFQHQELDTEHLLYALLTQEQGVVPEVVKALGASPEELAEAVKAELEARPKIQGSGFGGQERGPLGAEPGREGSRGDEGRFREHRASAAGYRRGA
jgi:ATP-dependent Clp protease ATP-binding subunit ClpA